MDAVVEEARKAAEEIMAAAAVIEDEVEAGVAGEVVEDGADEEMDTLLLELFARQYPSNAVLPNSTTLGTTM